ncbi:MAG TPA: phage tail tape measure protein [Chromatiales bacterium]|nr:phage tail tape measure protein [Chromatiales bacterium]
MASELKIILIAKNQASAALKQVQRDLGSLDKKAGLASRGFSGLQSVVGTGLMAAGSAGAASMVALGAGIANATAEAASMEAQISGIAAVLGVTKEQVAPLKDLFLALGLDPTLQVNATQAADAIEMLARNGLNMSQIMNGAARNTVLLANATGADFSTAADIATDTMALFNISAENMGQAVNGITSVVNNSKFSIDDYRLALAQGGGVASAVGVDFQDFNATIAAISPLFASGSDAGTSFKTFLQRLTPQSSKAAEAMAALGIITEDGSNKFFDAEGNLKSMDEIAGILQTSLSGLSDEQRNQALATIFGTDAMRTAVGLAETGKEGFQALKDTMAQTDAEEAAKTRMDNFAGTLEILKGVVETLKLKIGDEFLPVFRQIAEEATKLVDQYGDQIVAFFAGMASGFAVLIGQIPQFITQVQAIIAWLGALVPDWIEWKDVLTAVGIVVAATIIPVLASFVTAAAPVIAAAAALVAGVALLREGWETDFLGIRTFLEEAWTAMQPWFEALGLWLGENIPKALETLRNVWNVSWPVIKSVLQAQWNIIKAAFGAVKTFLTITLPSAVRSFKQTWSTSWTTIKTTFNTVVGPIKTALNQIRQKINLVKSSMNSFKEWLGSLKLPNPFAGLSNAAGGIVDAVKGVLPGQATGTLYAAGGLTVVGEQGPEIVALPRGSRVFNASESRRLAAAGALGNGGVTVVVQATVANELDLQALAYRVADIIQRRARR